MNFDAHQRALVILDPSLRSFGGHFLTYDKIIADEAKKHGVRTIVLAGRTADPSNFTGLETVPCFRFDLETPESDRKISQAFYSDLAKGLDSLALTTPPILFLHTTTYRQIEPAVQVIALERFLNYRLTLLLRYSIEINPYCPDRHAVQQYGAALRAIKKYPVNGRVRLVTDSELLVDEYRTVTDLPIDVVPIPHVRGDDAPPPSAGQLPTITYLGNARSTKGFQYLPHLIAQIRPELLRGEWAAEIQANVMFKRDTESVVALCALRNEPITLWEHSLSLPAYEALLNRANLVVIPYQSLYYHTQTSGVFAEAIGKAKPVVVPKGSWMARQLRGTGAGTLFMPDDRVDLAKAVRDAMNSITELSSRARAFKDVWIKRHNPASFLAGLLAEGAIS